MAKSFKILADFQEGLAENDDAAAADVARNLYTADILFDVNRYLWSC